MGQSLINGSVPDRGMRPNESRQDQGQIPSGCNPGKLGRLPSELLLQAIVSESLLPNIDHWNGLSANVPLLQRTNSSIKGNRVCRHYLLTQQLHNDPGIPSPWILQCHPPPWAGLEVPLRDKASLREGQGTCFHSVFPLSLLPF